jgi:hypothetical protein
LEVSAIPSTRPLQNGKNSGSINALNGTQRPRLKCLNVLVEQFRKFWLKGTLMKSFSPGCTWGKVVHMKFIVRATLGGFLFVIPVYLRSLLLLKGMKSVAGIV